MLSNYKDVEKKLEYYKQLVLRELVKKGVGRYSVSMTTRKKRSNEIEGISYFFVRIK